MDTEKNISRRSAIKIMGGAVSAAALASLPVSASLTSCAKTGGKRLVFFFSGTGNCLHVARRLGGEALSIPQLLKTGNLDFTADEIGIVYPVYMHLPPRIVLEFLDKVRMKADYFFAIATFGNRSLNACELFDEIARERGYKFHYINSLLMVDNFLPSFDMADQQRSEKKEERMLDYMIGDLAQRREYIEPATDDQRRMHQEGIARIGGVGFGYAKAADMFVLNRSACTSCGTCTDCCPRGNITVLDNGPVFEGDCEYCLACIQNCPQKALTLHRERNPEHRYRHKEVSLADIKRANSQK